jgi:hypothetical protein
MRFPAPRNGRPWFSMRTDGATAYGARGFSAGRGTRLRPGCAAASTLRRLGFRRALPHAVSMIRSQTAGFLAALLLVALGGPAAAPDPGGDALPAIPPPPRAAAPAGEVLFAEDFRTLDAWQADRDSIWSVEDGVLCGHLPDGKQERSLLFAGSTDWQDYAVDLDLCQVRGVDKGVVVCVRGGRGVAADLRGGRYQDVLLYRQQLPLGSAPVANPDRTWHHLRVEARGARFTILVNGARVLERRDPLGSMRRGRIALPAYTGGQGECAVFYANVVVTRLKPARQSRGDPASQPRRGG